jgi:hypothetical protein
MKFFTVLAVALSLVNAVSVAAPKATAKVTKPVAAKAVKKAVKAAPKKAAPTKKVAHPTKKAAHPAKKAPVGCHDAKPSCAAWALDGYCGTSPFHDFTVAHCKLSCKACGDAKTCVDQEKDKKNCEVWKKQGLCKRSKNAKLAHWENYVVHHCQKTCGICKVVAAKGAKKHVAKKHAAAKKGAKKVAAKKGSKEAAKKGAKKAAAKKTKKTKKTAKKAPKKKL